MNRVQNLERLVKEEFDVCIIGAGASGSGVALDASLRGYKVALIDSGDFCGETSSKSTKLIHGGVRYLEQAFKNLDFGQLKQVKHGLRERKFLYSNAPYITKKLGIVTPVFSFIEGLYYYLGLKIYGFFAIKDDFPSARWLTRKEILADSPNIISKVHSGVLYYDGQLDYVRLVVSLVKTAEKKGAVVSNYCKLVGFEKDYNGKLKTAQVQNVLSGEKFDIKAKVFVNCTGPFADTIRFMANEKEEPRIAPSKGVHVVLSNEFFKGDRALLIPKTSDGRLVFVIPFRNKVMIGTTDTPYKEIDKEPHLELSEAKYLIEMAKPYLQKLPELSDIKAGFGGVRPLLMARRRSADNTKSLLRDHEVEHDETSGLVSLLGGKWTTYRLMAEDTVNTIDELLKAGGKCQTHDYKLVGNDLQIDRPPHVEDSLWNRLLSYYGTQINLVLELDGGRFDKINAGQAYLKAEVVFACRYEMAQKIRDFMARRVRWEILDWESCTESVSSVAEIMAAELHWSDERKTQEIAEYRKLLIQFQEI